MEKMPQRGSSTSNLMRPFVVLALPGMYLLYKYNQYRQQQMETARRRVTERELMHLNTKIKCDDECRRAIVDIPPKVDPLCPKPCERRKKKQGILHRIKLKIIEGGTNFGTPFRRLQCKEEVCKKEVCKEEVCKEEKPKALPSPKKVVPPKPDVRPGVQVSVLGADTAIGQYVSLLLKQCPCIKKLRLYEAKDSQCSDCTRDLCNVVEDLKHINTNCRVQAFSCACNELERCLQNTDIVLILESGYLNADMPFDKRFCYQAPIVKNYADAIANECPKAFIIVCASPIDCMVPLIAQTLKETGWYDPRKLLGSLAVPEMRASTLAARALSLEPRYTRVPIVGGTEGEALVPLFSKAVEHFDFAQHNALMLTDAVRAAPLAVSRSDGACMRAADLSEAHALAGLVTKVAHALLCNDVPRVTGFVETDANQVISPARFIANTVEISGSGISKSLGLPKMTDWEIVKVDYALNELYCKLNMVHNWYCKYSSSSCRLDSFQLHFFRPKPYQRFLAIDVLLNNHGVYEKFDLPPKMNTLETDLMDIALSHLTYNVMMAQSWHAAFVQSECVRCNMLMQTKWYQKKHYDHLDDCTSHLT